VLIPDETLHYPARRAEISPLLGVPPEQSGPLGGRAVNTLNLDIVKKLGVTVVALFLVISFWSDPSGSAAAFGSFLDQVGRFFSTIIDKTVAFVRGIG
jgi:hypothetical protein